jgi:hypothetical protein
VRQNILVVEAQGRGYALHGTEDTEVEEGTGDQV